MHSKSQYIESGRKAIALFFMVLLFFVYGVEAMHHHKNVSNETHTKHKLAEYSPQCLICDQLQHQHHDLIDTGFVTLPEAPVFESPKKECCYLLSGYAYIIFISANKDPPLTDSYNF